MNKSDFIKKVHQSLHAAGIESAKSKRPATIIYEAFDWFDKAGLTIDTTNLDGAPEKMQKDACILVRKALTDAGLIVVNTRGNPLYTYLSFADNGVE
jgi:hypothetical protein